MFKVASIQLAHNDTDTKEMRIAHAEEMIDKAAGANLMLLPETWNVGWWSFDKWQSESEPLQGETISRIASKAKKHNAYIHAGSIVEKDKDGKLYNTAVLINPNGQIIATYRKMHLVGFKVAGGLGAEEKFIAGRGQGPVAIKTELGTLGFGICYDIRFPELFRKLAIDHKVEVILFISCWPITKLDNWRAFTMARANENLCWLVSCDSCGVNRGAMALGYSNVVNPNGIIVAEAGWNETIVKSEIEVNEIYSLRKSLTALDDRCL